MKLPFEKIKRKVITLKEAKTNKEYGKEPKKRTIEELLNQGVLCLNKPSGPTSHLTSDYLKKILKAKRSGHGGTLDPKVTGVLPIALNNATRISQFLLLAGKEYICIMHLHKEASEKEIKQTFKKFTGKITQLPPIRSAVKRRNRQREIYYIKILEIKGQDILFKIGCQAGTYIRKICHDLGETLGTGAHMAQLVRSKAGPFNDKEMYSLHDIKDAYTEYKKGNKKQIKKILKPIEYAIQHLPKIWILDSAVDTICNGADLKVPGIAKMEDPIKQEETVAILTLKNELVAIGIASISSDTIWKSRKNIAVQTQKVFMTPGLYPKFQKAHPHK